MPECDRPEPYCDICTDLIKKETNYREITLEYLRGKRNTISYGTCHVCTDEILRFMANRALEARKQ